jgi:hypothetical protein
MNRDPYEIWSVEMTHYGIPTVNQWQTTARGQRAFSGRLVSGVLLLLAASGVACMSAPMSRRFQPYSAESPTTGPAGVPGSGGTGAAGSFGSGGTMGGTTAEGAQTPGNESAMRRRTPIFGDGGLIR